MEYGCNIVWKTNDLFAGEAASPACIKIKK